MEKVAGIHDERYFEKVRRSSNAPSPLTLAKNLKQFVNAAVPVFKTYPSVRIWQVSGSIEEFYLLRILLEEEGLGSKAIFYYTDPSEQVLLQARQGKVSPETFKDLSRIYKRAGGRHSPEHYYVRSGKAARFAPKLRKGMNFFQHNATTDASFIECNAIFCSDLMGHVPQELRATMHQLFLTSLCPLGFLSIGKQGLAELPTDFYKNVGNGKTLFQRIK